MLAARAAIAAADDDILVMFADTPLVRVETLATAARRRSQTARRSRCLASRRAIRRATAG